MATIKVNISMLPGCINHSVDRYTLATAIPTSTSIAEVRRLIQQSLSSNTEPSHQRLIYNGFLLRSNEATLAEALRIGAGSTQNDYTLHLVIADLQNVNILPPAFVNGARAPGPEPDGSAEAMTVCIACGDEDEATDTLLLCGHGYHTDCLAYLCDTQVDQTPDGEPVYVEDMVSNTLVRVRIAPNCAACREPIGRSRIPPASLRFVLQHFPDYPEHPGDLLAWGVSSVDVERDLSAEETARETAFRTAGVHSRYAAGLASARRHQGRKEYIRQQHPLLALADHSLLSRRLRDFTTMVTPRAAAPGDVPRLTISFRYTEKIGDVMMEYVYYFIAHPKDFIQDLVALWASANSGMPTPVGVTSTRFYYGDLQPYGGEALSKIGIADGDTLTLERTIM